MLMGASACSACSKAEKADATAVGEKAKPSAALKDGEDASKKAKFLGKVPLFKKLTQEVLISILKVSTEVKFEAGSVIINQGDAGVDLFVIVKGEAEVIVDGKNTGHKLKVGDYFGETGLLRDEPRTATIQVTQAGPFVAIMTSRPGFLELEIEDQLDLVEKNKLVSLKKTEGSASDKKKIKFLSKVSLFDQLDEKTLKKILEKCTEVKFSKGEEMIKQDDSGSDLFLIIKGTTSIRVSGKEVATFKVGDYVGEKGLLADEVRSATVVATDKVLAIKLCRAAFEKLGLRDKLHFAEER